MDGATQNVVQAMNSLTTVLQNGQPRNTNRPVGSYSVIAPRPFDGTADADTAENWLTYLTRYCVYRQFTRVECLRLFTILLRNQAADWLLTLGPDQTESFDTLVAAFMARFFSTRRNEVGRRQRRISSGTATDSVGRRIRNENS